MPGILTGQVNPGRVFDRELTLDQIPEGYKEMDSRQALKVLVRPYEGAQAGGTAGGAATLVGAERPDLKASADDRQ